MEKATRNRSPIQMRVSNLPGAASDFESPEDWYLKCRCGEMADATDSGESMAFPWFEPRKIQDVGCNV
jgi:hypothetical protein